MSIEILQADCKRAVANISSLSNDELDAIINDDEKIQEIITNLDQSYLKEIEQEKENILASNNSMAEFNLSKEPELVEGREKIKELSELGEQLTRTIEEKMKELRDKGGDMSLETALALLQTSASEMEEESDKVAKRYLDGEGELDDFLDDFLEKRKIMHLRLVKAEKLSKILQSPSMNNVSNYINAPPVNINSNFFPGVSIPGSMPPPYPIGQINNYMPMPHPLGNNYFQNHY
ncbi:vacuolar protein sorting-associated protein 37B [Diorhabda carinulata]|uniref:vacuolar protein sorting-associated protein 37B n=1 Tax=Diorhabda sublineata TaxID=1163346 RepID=UPI0024E167E2|nr:vacuolar protein sorting-associated protein 37B [Diorhabda sublineata]XP_057669056.1 vacuolar protein sorting-associated protein 37B [Diorhabda carinulata]